MNRSASRVPKLCFMSAFYSAKEKTAIVLNRHFDLLYNDGCPIGGKAIIRVLGGWQVSSEVVS